MASQVLSGSSNVSYTNNTGQNVRVVINFMESQALPGSWILTINWAGVSWQRNGSFNLAIGKTMLPSSGSATGVTAYPTDIMLAPGQAFSAQCGVHNIVVIREDGG